MTVETCTTRLALAAVAILILAGTAQANSVPGYAPASPAAYHSFDNSVLPGNDDSGNSNNGTLTSANYTAAGKDGGAMELPTDNGRMLIARAGGGNGVDIGNDWSVAAWFKDIHTSSWRTLFRGSGSDHQVIIENGNTRSGMFANGHGNFRPAAPQYDIPNDFMREKR